MAEGQIVEINEPKAFFEHLQHETHAAVSAADFALRRFRRIY